MTRNPTKVLVVEYRPDYAAPDVFGPFETVGLAQAFAEKYRRLQGLPVESSPENNETWTDLGWYFGIVDLEPDTTRLEAAMREHPEVWASNE